jgi:DNA-binding IclR family transcriptional regulator
MSQFWPWGSLSQDVPPEMKQVLETGKRVTVQKRPGMTSVLAPVYDSLGDVVAIVEVVTMARPDPRENVK